MSYFLRNVAPNFMWCTVFDLFLMYEQINWDVEWNCFRQRFHQLFQEGVFLEKPDYTHRRNGKTRRRLYIRKSEQSNDEGGR